MKNPSSSQKKPFYNTWLFISFLTAIISAAFFTYFLVRFPNFNFTDAFILVLGITFLLMVLRNPKYRFYRMGSFLFAIGAFSKLPSFIINHQNSSSKGTESFLFKFNDIPASVTITVLIAGFLLFIFGAYIENPEIFKSKLDKKGNQENNVIGNQTIINNNINVSLILGMFFILVVFAITVIVITNNPHPKNTINNITPSVDTTTKQDTSKKQKNDTLKKDSNNIANVNNNSSRNTKDAPVVINKPPQLKKELAIQYLHNSSSKLIELKRRLEDTLNFTKKSYSITFKFSRKIKKADSQEGYTIDSGHLIVVIDGKEIQIESIVIPSPFSPYSKESLVEEYIRGQILDEINNNFDLIIKTIKNNI